MPQTRINPRADDGTRTHDTWLGNLVRAKSGKSGEGLQSLINTGFATDPNDPSRTVPGLRSQTFGARMGHELSPGR